MFQEEEKIINEDKIQNQTLNEYKSYSFKLLKLNNMSLRYEVIYKNLLRDIRKFYI